MNESNQLLRKADLLFDANQFEDAIQIYKQVALLEDPSVEILSNLESAQRLAHLTFLNKVIKRHPDSLGAHMHKISWYIAAHRAKQAFAVCNELLTKHSEGQGASLRISSLRMKAAIESGNGQFLAEDFAAIWNSLANLKGKQRLLKNLLSASHPHLASSFSQLSEDQGFSESLRALFQRKAELLEMLDEVCASELQL